MLDTDALWQARRTGGEDAISEIDWAHARKRGSCSSAKSAPASPMPMQTGIAALMPSSSVAEVKAILTSASETIAWIARADRSDRVEHRRRPP